LRRNLWFASELARIVEAFKNRRVRVVAYKGPLLAESAYGDIALRNFGDLDLLISPGDHQPATQILRDLGYQPSSEFSPAVGRFWLNNGYERSFDSGAGKSLVELQWALLPRLYALDLRTDDLLARSQTAAVGGREVQSLSPEDSLVALCVHAAKHLWMRLIWVCDIAETIRTQPLDWVIVSSRAAELGIMRIMAVSLWLVRDLLDCALPESAVRMIDSDPSVTAQAKAFASRLARSATYDFESTEYFRLLFHLRERRRDRARYLWRLLWTPGQGELNAIRLNESLFPLYRVVRVMRLVGKLFRARRQRAGVPRTAN
jgi:hypothetical protein